MYKTGRPLQPSPSCLDLAYQYKCLIFLNMDMLSARFCTVQWFGSFYGNEHQSLILSDFTGMVKELKACPKYRQGEFSDLSK